MYTIALQHYLTVPDVLVLHQAAYGVSKLINVVDTTNIGFLPPELI